MVTCKGHDSRILGFQSCTTLIVNKKYMTTLQKQSCMFVGIDVHKDTHTAVGISPYGEKLFEITVGNYNADFKNSQKKLRKRKVFFHPSLDSKISVDTEKDFQNTCIRNIRYTMSQVY